jgi:transcriptional regulator with XRE-family HTH domain
MGSPTIKNPLVRHLVAQNVRHHLSMREWSESELARRSGVSQKQVNNITRERYGCTIEALFEMARAFRVPPYSMIIPGISESDASLDQLDKVIVGFLTGSEKTRRKLLASV